MLNLNIGKVTKVILVVMVGEFDGKNLTNEGQRRVYSIAVSLFMNRETPMLSREG